MRSLFKNNSVYKWIVIAMLLAICGSCNKSITLDPQNPDDSTPSDTVPVDTISKIEVSAFIYVPPFVYNYCDIELYNIDQNGDTTKYETIQRATPVDTAFVDSIFADYYDSRIYDSSADINDVIVFTNASQYYIPVNNRCTLNCKLVRNSTKLDYQSDRANNYAFLFPLVFQLDDRYWIDFLTFYLDAYHNVGLGDSEESAEAAYKSSVIDKFNQRYFVFAGKSY